MPDPFSPPDWDRYSYVQNNPIRYNDPSGHYVASNDEGKGNCTNSLDCVYPEGHEKAGEIIIPPSEKERRQGAQIVGTSIALIPGLEIGDDIATANTGCGYVCQLRGEEKVGPLWRIVAAVSIVLPVSSTSLRKAMGIVDGSLDAHHLIPRAFSNHQFIRMATGAGWNIDHAYNGIALPKEIHGAIPGHPGYNDYVEEKLDELYNNAIVYGWSPDDAYEELMNLAQSLRIQIKQGQ